MGRSRHRMRGQLIFELEPVKLTVLQKEEASGLIEALADLLLEALGAGEATSTNKEGVDERESHA